MRYLSKMNGSDLHELHHLEEQTFILHFLPFPTFICHILCPDLVAGKGILTKGHRVWKSPFLWPHCFHVQGLRIILVATFSPIISCEFPEEHPLVQVDNVKFVPKFQGLKV